MIGKGYDGRSSSTESRREARTKRKGVACVNNGESDKMAGLMEQWRAFAEVLACREGGAILEEGSEQGSGEALQRTLRELVCPCAPWWDRGASDYGLAAPGVWTKVIEGWRKAARREMSAAAHEYAGMSEKKEKKQGRGEQGGCGKMGGGQGARDTKTDRYLYMGRELRAGAFTTARIQCVDVRAVVFVYAFVPLLELSFGCVGCKTGVVEAMG